MDGLVEAAAAGRDEEGSGSAERKLQEGPVDDSQMVRCSVLLLLVQGMRWASSILNESLTRCHCTPYVCLIIDEFHVKYSHFFSTSVMNACHIVENISFFECLF